MRVKEEKKYQNPLAYMDLLCHLLKTGERAGTANLYKSCKNKFSKFLNGRLIDFRDITPAMIREYEVHLRQQHLSPNSIYTYMSNLRSIYNKACGDDLSVGEKNPFVKQHYRQGHTHKRAVMVENIEKIAALELKNNPPLELARDLFLFSFLSCGIPFVDLAHLRRGNVIGNMLVYNRIKTNSLIRIQIIPSMQLMIDKYAGKGIGDYLFPVLKEENPDYNHYKAALRTYNRRLNKIGELSCTPVKLTSYVARHSWATAARRKNAPIGIISEALGHSSEKTTRIYLDSMELSSLDKINRMVTESVAMTLICNIRV